MKNILWSLIFFVPASVLAQSSSSNVEQKFQAALRSKVSREGITLQFFGSSKNHHPDPIYNLAKSPEEFSAMLESVPTEGPKMGLSIANFIHKTRTIKDNLILNLKDAVSKTKYLKHDEKSILELLSALDVKPSINLYKISTPAFSGALSDFYSVNLGSKSYCTYKRPDNSFPDFFSEAMRKKMDSGITPECIKQMTDSVSKMVSDKERLLAMRDALKEESAQRRISLNDDGRDHNKNASSSGATSKSTKSHRVNKR